jgi:hypothetical protein
MEGVSRVRIDSGIHPENTRRGGQASLWDIDVHRSAVDGGIGIDPLERDEVAAAGSVIADLNLDGRITRRRVRG